MAEKRAVTIRIDPEIYEQIKVAAESDHRSVNNWIEVLLMETLKQAVTNEELREALNRVIEEDDELLRRLAR